MQGIDLIIVNWRTADDLDRCIQSLYDNRPESEFTVWIVNNAPLYDDDVVAEKWSVAEQNTFVIRHKENIGYARAVNDAAARGDRELIGIFNADVLFTPDVIDTVGFVAWQNERWGVIGPRQLNSRGLVTHAGIFGTLEQPQHRGWQQPDRDEFHDIALAVTVSGSAYFVKRRCWNELTECKLFQDVAPGATGAFLPTPHYYEETWCSYHAYAHQWDVVYYGTRHLIHEWHRASPVGGVAEQTMPVSKHLFQRACDHHSLPHD